MELLSYLLFGCSYHYSTLYTVIILCNYRCDSNYKLIYSTYKFFHDSIKFFRNIKPFQELHAKNLSGIVNSFLKQEADGAASLLSSSLIVSWVVCGIWDLAFNAHTPTLFYLSLYYPSKAFFTLSLSATRKLLVSTILYL